MQNLFFLTKKTTFGFCYFGFYLLQPFPLVKLGIGNMEGNSLTCSLQIPTTDGRLGDKGLLYTLPMVGSHGLLKCLALLKYSLGFFFVDNQNGWVAGNFGRILHTSNGGQTWKYQPNPGGNFNSIKFVNAQIGWVVGSQPGSNGALIANTLDGGQTWNLQTSGVPSNEIFYDLSFIDTQNGWVVGTAGTILHTTNGGQSWETQFSNPNVALKSVHFVDHQNGWAVGTSGLIFKTINAGQNWNIVESGMGEYADINDVFFADLQNGWVVGDDGFILKYNSSPINTIESESTKNYLSNPYPMPFESNFNIDVYNKTQTQKTHSILFNNLGQRVYTKTETLLVGKNTITYSVESLPPGIYFLSIYFDEKIAPKTIVTIKE